jgi:programmed cell death protein 5
LSSLEGVDERKRAEEERRAAREQILKVVFTSEARQRLTNVRMVKPDIARLVEDQVVQLASTGKLTRPISDEELKSILGNLQQPKREFKIKWV